MTKVQTFPLSLTCLPASLRKKNAHFELTALISSNSGSLISTMGFLSTLPTVLTAISTEPMAAFASAKSFSMDEAVVRSA